MQEKHFEEFVKVNKGKKVAVTVKNPKRNINGELCFIDNEFIVKTSSINDGKFKTDMVKINHENTKAISVIITKEERIRRKTERRQSFCLN